MATRNSILAVDLGTTRTRAVLAEPDGRGDVAIHATASRPAAGLQRGELVDLGVAAGALRELLDELAAQAAIELPERAVVGVVGDGLRAISSRGAISLPGGGGAVTAEQLARARRKVETIEMPFDQALLHCWEVEYTLDGRGGLQSPLGMIGSRLELDAHLVAGDQSTLANVDQVARLAGLECEQLVFPPCATGCYLVEANEKEQGCLVVDIGGEATHFALYYRGRLRRSGVLPVGGNHVTRDLAYGLGCSEAEAENIKRRHGSALRSAAAPAGPAPADLPLPKVAAICEARQMEVLELVAQGLQWGITRPALAAGILLTGGGARLRGSVELAEQVFSLRAGSRRAPGDDYADEPDSWATALGLVQLRLEAENHDRAHPHAGPVRPRIVNTVKRLIGKLV